MSTRFAMSLVGLFAQATEGDKSASAGLLPDTFWVGLIGSLVFGIVGIALAVLGFKVFDLLTPKINVERELAEKQNIAVAIVAAAVILGICYIVAHVVH